MFLRWEGEGARPLDPVARQIDRGTLTCDFWRHDGSERQAWVGRNAQRCLPHGTSPQMKVVEFSQRFDLRSRLACGL